MGDANRKTQDLVETWQRASARVVDLQQQLNRAEVDRLNTANQLAKHLWPEGAHESETFNIWVRDPLNDKDRLLTVTRKGGVQSAKWYADNGSGRQLNTPNLIGDGDDDAS